MKIVSSACTRGPENERYGKELSQAGQAVG